jgi:hypothetical protein
MKSITAFGKTVKKGSLLGNIVLKRYLGNTRWLKNALAGKDRERYEETIEIIKRFADQYEFDWLVIAAQAYQESRFDQSKRSPAGAVGVMQLMPSTAADKAVGIPDVSTLDPCRGEIPELAATDILLKRDDFSARPGAVLVRCIQRRAGQYETGAQACKEIGL